MTDAEVVNWLTDPDDNESCPPARPRPRAHMCAPGARRLGCSGSRRHRDDDTYAGALHAPPGTIVAFRTDAVYLTQPQTWPHHGQPGDYLNKGRLPGPIPAPATEDELLTLRDRGRAAHHAAPTSKGA